MSAGFIHTTLSLKQDCIFWNGTIEAMLGPNKLSSQLDAIYKKMIRDYPKYYRMDGMAKLVFILGELLCERTDVCEDYNGQDIAVIMFNTSGSYPSDLIHSEAIKTGFDGSSPANFVYTLPNVGVGELCIKRKITGENAFFIEDELNVERISSISSIYLEQNRCKAVIIGWVEPTQNEGNHLLLITGKKGGLSLPNSESNIRNLLV